MEIPIEVPAPRSPAPNHDLALVLTGGGARGAYQVGVLRYMARRFPDLNIPVLCGVSAGAINAAHLAQHHGSFSQSVEELVSLWLELTPEQIFRVDAASLLSQIGAWGLRLLSGGRAGDPRVQGLVDTAPLGEFLTSALAPVRGRLTGIDYNLHRGTLKALSIGTTSYTTGQSVVWVHGKEIEGWERPMRRGVQTRIGLKHVMASAALPLFFPAVRIGREWYGDGGIRLAAPLSPALHLGARRILAISNQHGTTQEEAGRPLTRGYPPPAQVLGVMMNSVFLDVIDQDVARLERMNRILNKLPEDQREEFRPIDLLVLRPSQDLGRLSAAYEPRLPGAFRFLTRGLGTKETESPDVLSMVMFQHDYLNRLIELGEEDAAAREDEIEAFLARGAEESIRARAS